MAIVKWVMDLIKEKLKAIPKRKVQKQHMPVAVYNAEFGKDVAAILEDKQQWLNAGFDPRQIEYYQGLSEELFRASAAVVASRKFVAEAVQRWGDEKDSVSTERSRLFAAVKVLAAGDRNKKKILKEIAEGFSNMDKVMDILSLVYLAEQDLERASTLTIGGKTINKAYLDETKAWASRIKDVLNKADEAREDRQEEVLYRNKLILLCRMAECEMDTWLDAVYFDRPERKNIFTSNYFRSVRADSSSDESVKEEIDEITRPQSADTPQQSEQIDS